MSTTLNRPGLKAWACLLGLFALAVSGCSDHGPVGIVAPELFHKNVDQPELAYYAATQISFTVQSSPLSNSTSNVYPYYTLYDGNTIAVPNLVVTVVNDGGSGTYGPVQCSFSASGFNSTADPFVLTFEGNDNGTGAWVSPQTGYDPSSQDVGTAISNLGSGSQITSFAGTQVTLFQGYLNNPSNPSNSSYVDDSPYYSLAFTVSPGAQGFSNWNGTTYTVPVTMNMEDVYGYTYVSSFSLYISLN
jgi:hypothetical protein